MPSAFASKSGTAVAAVAAGNAATAEVAAEILRDGGNAFDAAIAGLSAACVAEPVLCSLGGGGFLLAEPAGKAPMLLDFFVQTPGRSAPPDAASALDFREVTANFGTARQAFHIGRAAAAVPGMVAGIFEIHRRLGHMPIVQCLAPARRLAADGVILDPLQAHILEVVTPIVSATKSSRAVFCTEAGETLSAGVRFHLPGFAEVLDALAAEGPDLFYRGTLAERIVEACAEGGLLRQGDLARYEAVWRTPRQTRFRGARVAMADLPSAGGPLIDYSLRLLDALAPVDPDTAAGAVAIAAVQKNTGDARRDSGFARHPDPPRAAALLDPDRITDGIRALKQGGTTHISIADAQGNLASLSLSNGEGNGHVIPGTGIVMNNMLGEEDLHPTGFFRWTPDTRVTSMMTPTIADLPDGRRVALGSGGSNRIRSAILQTLVRLIDGNADLAQAIAAPRLHVEDGRLSVEGGCDGAAAAALERAFPGAAFWPDRSFFFGGVHAVALGAAGVEAAGDPRRGGCAVTVV